MRISETGQDGKSDVCRLVGLTGYSVLEAGPVDQLEVIAELAQATTWNQ